MRKVKGVIAALTGRRLITSPRNARLIFNAGGGDGFTRTNELEAVLSLFLSIYLCSPLLPLPVYFSVLLGRKRRTLFRSYIRTFASPALPESVPAAAASRERINGRLKPNLSRICVLNLGTPCRVPSTTRGRLTSLIFYPEIVRLHRRNLKFVEGPWRKKRTPTAGGGGVEDGQKKRQSRRCLSGYGIAE